MALNALTREIRSKRWLKFPVPESGRGVQYFEFTGIGLFGMTGAGKEWERGVAHIEADYSHLVKPDTGVIPQYWTAEVQLASIMNKHHAVNTGWAVDESDLEFAGGENGKRYLLPNGVLSIKANVAIRDVDAIIYRLSYRVSVLGHVEDFARPRID